MHEKEIIEILERLAILQKEQLEISRHQDKQIGSLIQTCSDLLNRILILEAERETHV